MAQEDCSGNGHNGSHKEGTEIKKVSFSNAKNRTQGLMYA
jgi:hypothetical protein